MIRKIILIMEMIMNIPKLLMRFYEKKKKFKTLDAALNESNYK